jgi:hypothetical protein
MAVALGRVKERTKHLAFKQWEIKPMGLTPEETLAIDHQKARDHAENYITVIQNQITSRGLILAGAIQEFNEFRNLPASTNLGAAIWDFAFELISKAVPALKIGEFIKKQHEIASVALKAAEAFGQQARRADKVVKNVTGAAQILGKVAERLNDAKGIKEKGDKVFETPKSLAEHASRKPIKELIAELKQAQEMWNTAIKAERAEWENRLADNPGQWGSLEDNIKAMLPEPPLLSEKELDEVWTLYLYQMIGIWAGPQKNVKIVETSTDYGYGQFITTRSVDGLNDTQEGQILEWFGPKAPRGRFYLQKPFKDIWQFLASFPVELKVKTIVRRERHAMASTKY